jgi:uncharacterized lipoprotein
MAVSILNSLQHPLNLLFMKKIVLLLCALSVLSLTSCSVEDSYDEQLLESNEIGEPDPILNPNNPNNPPQEGNPLIPKPKGD